MKRKIWIGIFTALALACCVCLCISVVSVFQNGGFPDIGSHFDPDATVYELEVLSTEGGTVNVSSGQYTADEIINLEAYPDDGYVFSGWFDKKDSYITASENYTFTISQKTKLYAKFGKKPDEITGTAMYYDELKDCPSNFSFIIKSDKSKEWLEKNLKIVDDDFIGTEFEDFEEVNIKFTVEELGNGEFLISPIGEYDPGTTYTALIKEDAEEESDVSFVDDLEQGDSLTFSIEKDETDIVEEKEGIIYLSKAADVVELFDDGLMSGDEGDAEDKVVLKKAYGIEVGSIICIYSGALDAEGKPVIDDETIYGKCVSVNLANGVYEVVYDAPDLSEIYEKLDIYMNTDIDLEESGAEISEETLEEIKYAFMSQDEFHELLAAINVGVKKEANDKGYEIEELISKENFLDMIDIKTDASIKGKQATVMIYAAINIPLYKNKKQVAQVSVSCEFRKSVELNATFNYQLKKVWFVPVGLKSYDIAGKVYTTDTSTIKFAVAYDKGSAGFGDEGKELDKNQMYENCVEAFTKKNDITKEKNNITKLFTDAGYDLGNRREIRLFALRYYFSIITVNFEVKFFMEFDISGSIYYTSSSTTSSKIGIRSSNGGAGKVYQEKYGSSSASEVYVTGAVGVKGGIDVEAYFSVAGLSKYIKAGVGVEAGINFRMEGYVAIPKFYAAGMVKADVYVKGYLFYKVFSLSGEFDIAVWEKNLLKLGYDKTIMSWAESDDITDEDYTLNIIGRTDLFDNADLHVNVYTTGESIEAEELEWNSEKYKVEVTVLGGQWLEYKDGYLCIKSGAPMSFRDKIRISVKSSNVWGAFKDDSYCSYLPEIEIDVLYGDEDAYYDTIDTKVEKEFRRLYRSYNSTNIEILEGLLGDLIKNMVTEENTKSNIFVAAVDEYMEAMFDTIKEYKEVKDKYREMENKFVYTEAEVFVKGVDWINEMTKEKDYENEEFKALLLDIGKSEVMYNTLYALSVKPEHRDEIEKFDLTEEEKQKLADNLNWYRSNCEGLSGGRTADDVIRIFDDIFDLGERVWNS